MKLEQAHFAIGFIIAIALVYLFQNEIITFLKNLVCKLWFT